MTVSFSKVAATTNPAASVDEVEHLRAQIAALQQLLEVYEQGTVEKSTRLEQTLADLHHHTQRLSHAESALATLRSLLNSVGDAVVVVDHEGNFLFTNPTAERLLGISPTCLSLDCWAAGWAVYLPDQVTPYPLEQFPLLKTIQGEERENNADPDEIFVRSPSVAPRPAMSDPSSTVQTPALHDACQWCGRNKQATGPCPSIQTLEDEMTTGHWFSLTTRSFRSPNGDIQGGIAVFHNITKLKQTEIALRQSETCFREQTQQLQEALDNLRTMQSQLVQKEKMSSLGELVAGVAHEINNPVNFIHGNLIYLQDHTEALINFIYRWQAQDPHPNPVMQAEAEAIDLPYLLEDLPKIIESMQMGTDRIRQIVLSLRNFSRLDEAESKSVDIHEGLESTLLLLKHRLKPRLNFPEIIINRNYGDLPLIECYPSQLNQVFMNILVNAIDALEDKDFVATEVPQISIRTALVAPEWVEIAIADNGIGMDEAVQDHIFDPFFTTKPVGAGTGMGMSISYQIITGKHQGKLYCFSTPGEGTEFVIQIPTSQTMPH